MNIKLALITGATSGIGKALAKTLSRQGVELIVSGRNKAELQSLPGQPVLADLATNRAPLLEVIADRKPDLLINSAGYGLYGHSLTRPTSDAMSMLEVNIMALSELTLEAARAMSSTGLKGTILNVSSAASWFPFPDFSFYAASKTYVTQLSQALDFEFSPQGVRVLVSCPGQVQTNFRERAGDNSKKRKSLGVMSADYAAERILRQIKKGQGVDTFNWPYKAFRLISWLPLPKQLLLKLLRDSISNRYPKKSIIPL